MNESNTKTGSGIWLWMVPAIITLLCLAYVLKQAAPKDYVDEKGFIVGRYATLPVSFGGRFQPWDSVARNALIVIYGKTTIKPEVDEYGFADGQPLPEEIKAVDWLLLLKSDPDKASRIPVFRIDEPGVLGLLGIQTLDKKYFTFAELQPALPMIQQQAQAANAIDKPFRNLFQSKVLDLHSHIQLYVSLANHTRTHSVPPSESKRQLIAEQQDEVLQRDAQRGIDRVEAQEDWLPLGDVMSPDQGPYVTGANTDVTAMYISAYKAYHDQDVALFNASITGLENLLSHDHAHYYGQAGFEAWFNQFAPFANAKAFYVFVALLVILSWVIAPQLLVRTALLVIVLTLLLHTAGLGMRIMISGRPPVTNLYSSAVFIGWAAAIFAVALEPILRYGIGILMACILGFSTLMIARALAADGDTLSVLVAVLDSNFWLATHVIVITLGYSATYLAGLLGIIFVLLGVFTKRMDVRTARTFGGVIYGVTCFALLFSFVGTILGGIWADQSWGRFWGWDPKENGALMIVLWGAIMLHARWGGMVQHRGLAILAILGNIVTTWSWFGVNMLGAGLHSYGFIDSAVFWLYAFVTTQIIFAGIGMIPLRDWRSDVTRKNQLARNPSSPPESQNNTQGQPQPSA